MDSIRFFSLMSYVLVAEAEKAGIEAAGGTATIFQVAETLPEEVLAKMQAPSKPDYPVIQPDQLAEFDAFLFGISARYGSWSAQFKVLALLSSCTRTRATKC